MKTWLIIQSLIDILLFVFVVWFLLKQGSKTSCLDKKHQKINESLRELFESSNRVSERIMEEKKICETLLAALDQKTGEFEKLVANAENISRSLQVTKANETRTTQDERYKLVARLADKGMNRDEISRVTGVLKGEVDLILNLSSK